MESITDGHVAVGGAHERHHPSVGTVAQNGEGLRPRASRRHTIGTGWDRALGVARDGDFARFWAAQSISAVGSQFTSVALPLIAAVSLGASPMAVGVLAAAAGFPHLLFGLFAGVWVDRLRRRPVMITADIGRAALLATIPLAAWFGTLRIEHLIAIAFLVETFTVFFDIAYYAFVPSLVTREQLVEANSRLEASASTAHVIGPAFGGTLVRLLGAPFALLVDAMTYLVSAVFLLRIGAPEPRPNEWHASGILHEIRQGLEGLWRDPILRALALSSGLVNLGAFTFLAVYVLYLTRNLGLGAGAVGLVFALGGAGAVLGSIAAAPARTRWGTGPVLMGSLILFGVFGLTVPLAVAFPRFALPLILAAEFLQWVTLLVYKINAVSLRQAMTPDDMLGRINGSMRFIMLGVWPIGSLIGGFFGSRIGLPATLVLGAMGMLLAFVPLLVSPMPRILPVR